MQLFVGSVAHFVDKAIRNEIAPTLESAFERYFGGRPSPSEINSWVSSLKDLSYSLRSADLSESSIVVEYRLPMTGKRLDAMILGHGNDGHPRASIIELKQWKRAAPSEIEDCVVMQEGKSSRISLHPSRQAGNYAEYLRGAHNAFYDDQNDISYIRLTACSFLHNALSRDCGCLLDPSFESILAEYPLYTGDMRDKFEESLSRLVGLGGGDAVLQKFLESRYRPSRRLLDHVASVIEGNPTYTLLDDQQVAYNAVVSKVKQMALSSEKAVVCVVGGPGTGKSVIAIRLLADLAKLGKNVVHCTGSKAFTTNLRATVGKQASALMKYFNGFVGEAPDSIDVMVADEAHRIRESSNTQWSRKSTLPQIEEIMGVSKVSVFFLDRDQVVRPGEVGTPELIESTAAKMKADYFQITLTDQYRCSGSDEYLMWLNGVLGLEPPIEATWNKDYDFRIVESPLELEKLLGAEREKGASARLVAGFCWPWSNPNADGQLVADVSIGNWSMPWNRKEKGSEPAHKHPYTLWATTDEGHNQVGCIYSAQGFEFDYCGVIFGEDLVMRDGVWVGRKEGTYDSVVKRSKNITDQLRNTYRVLLSRGIKGTFVHFLDPETRAHFEEAMKCHGDESSI